MDRPLTEGRTRAITKEGPTQINPSSKNTFTIKFKFILFLSLDMFFSRVFIIYHLYYILCIMYVCIIYHKYMYLCASGSKVESH